MEKNDLLSRIVLLEPLTRRETEILTLLAENRSNNEIADKLTLEVSSVKWYAHQIYAKLGVENRRQAVMRARELSLLSPYTPKDTPPNNLPRSLTHFIGREKQITQVGNLLSRNQLVTLTGSGGVGKTRLAVEVANAFLNSFSKGIRYVDLSRLANPLLVPSSVMDVIGLREEPGRAPVDSLVFYFSGSQALLLLDNCEHLAGACAGLVDTLLRSACELKVLATSREPLGVPGEVVYQVPSLSFPSKGQAIAVEEIHDYDSIQLFLDRAQSALPDFQINVQNFAAVVQIVQRLDGIPLAIELAASRIAGLDVEQIAARLDQAFRLLTGGGRTTLERHRTLRSAIDWSYQLISESERILLHRLSIFIGGWTLEAAEQVCKGKEISEEQILDLLTSLVNKSLVLADHISGEETRYRMLETIRQYALEELYRSGESETLHKRHCDYFVQLAEEAGLNLYRKDGLRWFKKLRADHDNMRAVLEWSIGEGTDPQSGLRLLNAVTELYWYPTGNTNEGYFWLEKGLKTLPDNAPSLAALKIRTLVNMQMLSCGITPPINIPLLEQGAALIKYLNPQDGVLRARVLGRLGVNLANEMGELQRGLQLVNEAEKVLREMGEESCWEFAMTLGFKAIIYRLLGNEAEFQIICQESASLFLKLGDSSGGPYFQLAEAAQRRGDGEQTKKYCDMGLEQSLAFNGQYDNAYNYRKVGDWMRLLGRNDEAVPYYKLSLKIYDSMGLVAGGCFALGGLAASQIAIAQSQSGEKSQLLWIWAVRILGAIQTVQKEMHFVTYFEDRMIFNQALASAQQGLEPAVFQSAWGEGCSMNITQVFAYALRGVDE